VGQDEHSKRVWDTDAERKRKRAYRERKRAEALGEPGEPGDPEQELKRSVDELIAFGRSGGELTAEEEQAIRDHFGYAASETRTLAQRDEAARKMVAGGPKSLSLTAFPYQQGNPLSKWSLVPSPEKLAGLHSK